MQSASTTLFLLTSKAQDKTLSKGRKQLCITLYGCSEQLGSVKVVFDNVPAIIAVEQEQEVPELKGLKRSKRTSS